MAIRVLLDSSALRWETATSPALGEVLQACELGLLELVVPEIVIKEVASGLAIDTRIAGRTRKEIVRAAAWAGQGDAIEAAIKLVHGFTRQAAASVEAGLRSHLERAGATIVPLGAPDLQAVLRDYFAGHGLFRNAPKVRDHLPDALIYDLVRQLAEDGPPRLVVVTRDRRLASACQALHGVVEVFSELTSLLESPWMREVHQERRASLGGLAAGRRNEQFDQGGGGADVLRAISAEMLGEHTAIEGLVGLQDVTIEQAESGSVTSLTWTETDELGQVSSSAQAQVVFRDVLIELVMPTSEWTARGDEPTPDLWVRDGDWGDHVVRLEGSVELVVHATIEARFEHNERTGELDYTGIDWVRIERVRVP